MSTRITGSDPSRPSEIFDSPETTEPTVPTAPAATGRTARVDASGGRDESTVERDTGPSLPPRPDPSPAGAGAAHEGPTLTAAQLAATGGRLPEDCVGDALRTIHEALSYGVFDWKITDAEMATVQKTLAALSPQDLRRVLDELATSGIFERFAGRMDDSQRAAFVGLCERQRIFQREAPKAERARAGDGEAPPVPSFIVQDAELPDALRRFIHDENLRAYAAYRTAHDAYLERFQARLESASHPMELKLLGDPQPPAKPHEPGLTRKTTLDRELEADWRRATDERSLKYNDVLIARSERAAQMAGRLAPMQVAATAEVKIEGALGQAAEVFTKPAFSVGARLGPDKGFTHTERVTPPNLKHAGWLEGDLDGTLDGVLGTKVKVQKKGNGEFRAQATLGPVVTYAGVDDHGKVSAGAGGKVDFGLFSAQATAGVEVQLADKQLNATAISMPGIAQETFRELEEGRPWDWLSPERQRQLTLRGFNKETWNAFVRGAKRQGPPGD
ncbi:MAG: hypothetical protein IRZ16_02310 [Myxococcaceae bacterium]|nr:hypothetical protein [Myxococcaceae bacterium]